jgi:hypothetical protein
MRWWVALAAIGCGVERDVSEPVVSPAEQAQIEEVWIAADDVADGQTVEAVLHDAVVFLVEPGVPLDQVLLVSATSEVLASEVLVEIEGEEGPFVFGTHEAVTAWLGDEAGLRKPGCWWVNEGGTWVRYCYA